jgi:hypothetical protein
MKPNVRIFLIIFFLTVPFATLAITVDLVATVPGCGDGIVASGEQCDTTNMSGSSCPSLGFAGGVLSCTLSCTFNTSACTSGVFGGGGGGVVIPLTSVVFVGKSSPRSTITFLKDAQITATTTAVAGGNFQVSISGISGGNYTFSVYSDDSSGIRSASLTFPIYITPGAITKVSDLFIAPTLSIDKEDVKRGDPVVAFGQSAPLAEITLSVKSVDSNKEFFIKKMTDINGAYTLSIDTLSLGIGRYQVKSKGTLDGESSPFGRTEEFVIGAKSVKKTIPTKCGKGDLNCDKRVNLTDFSIAAYWYKRPFSDAFGRIEIERLNGDGKVDLVDFSIMGYYWTG